MRPAYPMFGWFLVLALFSLGACNSLFLIPACEYDPRFEFCQQLPGGDLASDGGLADRPTDMSGFRPPMKPPVSFTLVAQSPLAAMRKWVGIRSPNLILFANQSPPTSDANIEAYNLLNTSQSWALVNVNCSICPASIKNVKLATDYVLTSKSMFFVIKPDYAYSINADGSLSSSTINSIYNKLTTNFRPFVSPDINVIAYQKNSYIGNSSEFIYFSNNLKQILSFAERRATPNTTYYVIGDLDVQGKNLSNNEILIFEEGQLRGAYRLDESLVPFFDSGLTDEINRSIDEAISSAGGPNSYPIRTGFIADLNRDNYMELVYARHQQIFVASYDPNAAVGHRFTNWPQSIINIDSVDHLLTFSTSDLDGNGYSDLAIEGADINNVPSKVLFYLNNQK